MRRVHDRGGWPEAGPIQQTDHAHMEWEKRTDALLMLLTSREKQVMRVDELRRAIEDLDPEAYVKRSYYERWVVAIENLMVEKGIFSREEVERKARALQASTP